jgi:hypothetical protein
MLRFGIKTSDLDSVASTVGRVLGVEFRPHESDWRGGAYCRAEVTGGSIIIQPNRDLLDDEPFETDWPPDMLLLFMDGGTEAEWGPYTEALTRLGDVEVVELR